MEIPMRTFALLAALAAPLSPALAQSGEGVTVVFSLDLMEGSSERAGLQSIQPILDFVRQQPGLIDEQLLQGQVGVAMDYVHVMRWERLEDFEAMFEDQAFLDTLTAIDPKFEPTAAEVYTPVR